MKSKINSKKLAGGFCGRRQPPSSATILLRGNSRGRASHRKHKAPPTRRRFSTRPNCTVVFNFPISHATFPSAFLSCSTIPEEVFHFCGISCSAGIGGREREEEAGRVSIEIQLENTSHDIKHGNGKWRRGARKFFNYAKNILNRSQRAKQARGRLVGCRVWKQLTRLRVPLDSFDLLKIFSEHILELATPPVAYLCTEFRSQPTRTLCNQRKHSNRLSRTLKPSKSGAPVEEVQSLSLEKLLLLLIRECRGLLLCCW